MNALHRNRKHVIIFFISLFLLLLVNVVFFYTTFSHIPYTYAQESGSISPTPAPVASSLPDIPKINPETLRDPDAFKLDQQIKQATRELFQTTDSSMRENKAEYRKTLMKQAIQKYPYVFLGNALTSSQISSFDPPLQQHFEKPLILSGVEFGVTHIDDFENHTNSRFDYSLQNLSDHTRFNFYPASSPNKQDGEEAFGGHISGTILNVNGVALDDDVSARVAGAPQGGGENNDPVITNVEILKEASPDALGPQRVAVILVKTKGSTFTPYYSKEQIEEMIFRGDVQKFFKETSYGKMWLDEEKSKVYGWYEVEGLNVDPWDDVNDTHTEDFIKLADPDVDFSQFDRVMVGGAVDSNSYGGWVDTVGKITHSTSDGDVFISVGVFAIGSSMNPIFSHEFGHNLGVMHANAWDCDKGELKGNCQHVEYRNNFDVMGTGNLDHFNAYFKEVFQWFNKPVTNITSSGRYTLRAIEYPDAAVAKITRKNASNFPIYYLEARAPVGFDDDHFTFDAINGIHVNWQYFPLATRFLSLSARSKSESDFLHQALHRGQSFHDEKSGVTITNIDDTTVNVQMEQPECKSYDFNTEIESVSAYPFVIYNDNDYSFGFDQADLTCQDYQCTLKRKKQEPLILAFGLKIRNNNSYACPDVRVRSFIDQAPWEKDPKLAIVENSIASSEYYQYFTPFVIIPATVQSGSYNIGVKAENVDSNQSIFINGRILQIVDDFQTLEGDLNNDNKVDIFDLVTVAKDFGKKGEGFAGDADKNNVVDIFDLVIVAKNFGKKIQ